MYSDMNFQAQISDTHSMRVQIKKDLDIRLGAIPDTSIVDSKDTGTSTLLGRDFPGTRFEVVTETGTSIRAGEPVLRHKRQPDILFTSPVSGNVSAVRRGAKRALSSLQITSDHQQDTIKFNIPAKPTGEDIRRLMLQSGLWTTLRCRPFGQIPDPGQNPEALLITAIDTQPLAPDPAAVIAKFPDEFSLGLTMIGEVVDAPLYLCKSPHSRFHLDDGNRALIAEFDGPHPAGLPGTHIHTLCPIDFSDVQAWHLNYQDVISLGHLIHSGRPWYNRIVSLVGPAVKKPRLMTVPLGAGTGDIIAGELIDGAVQIISGSVLNGHNATGDEACLGQRHHQITVIPETPPIQRSLWSGFWPESIYSLWQPEPAPENGSWPLIPTTDLDAVSPPGILAAPLLRALLVGDVERARDLGALELVEEDLALLSYLSSANTDYGPLLRNILDQLHKETQARG